MQKSYKECPMKLQLSYVPETHGLHTEHSIPAACSQALNLSAGHIESKHKCVQSDIPSNASIEVHAETFLT